MTPTRPVLRYMGGKWRLAPWILRHLPPHRTYVEPFGGAASVLLRKPRAYAEIYNDLDGEIVSLFRVLRDPEAAAELVRRIALTPFAREEFDVKPRPVGVGRGRHAPTSLRKARQRLVRAATALTMPPP